MSRLILSIVTGVLFLTGNATNGAPPQVPLRQNFTVVPRGTELIATITPSPSCSPFVITATVAENVIIDDAVVIPKGALLSGSITENRTEFTLLGDQPVWIVPTSSIRTKPEDQTLIAGSILIGAIVGTRINFRRPEVGALMGGILGLATVADHNSEMVPAVGDRVPLLIQRTLTVRL